MQPKDLIGTTMGQYQILDELGRGGMAVVYKAWQPSLRRYVALKVLLPYLGGDLEFIQRFQQEAIVAANLSHPHIVTIYEVGQQEGYIFIAMEYVEGKSLEQVILDQGALPLERAIRILRQVAEALDYAHKRRFLHRDIKPANILLAEDDRVVITDFGIAKALEGSGATARLTASGTVLGTPAYMSPEQIQGLPVDHRSDLYALGIVAYEMLSGQVPFDGTTTALLYAQVNNPPPAISRLTPGLPAHVEWVISRMLAKQPEERFMTASEFVEALAGGAGVTAMPAPVSSPRPTPAPRGGTAVMPPGTGVPPQPYVPPASSPAPQAYGTPPGGLPVGNSPAGYGYPSTQAAPQAYGTPPGGLPVGNPPAGYGYPSTQAAPLPAAPAYGYPQPGYSTGAPAWPEPAPVKQKRAVWPWLVGGGLILVIVAAAAVLGYLFLGRERPPEETVAGSQEIFRNQIAFVSEREGNADIFVINSDGTGLQSLTSGMASDYYPRWSPDGQRLSLHSYPPGIKAGEGDAQLYLIDLNTGNRTLLDTTMTDAKFADWSPDGEAMVFSGEKEGNWDLYVYIPDTGSLRHLSQGAANDYFPDWSPDGQKIVFVRDDEEGEREIYVASADGLEVQNLTNHPGWDTYPDWSPDGQQIAFASRRSDNIEIFLMASDGSNIRQLTSTPGYNNSEPHWNPDGKKIVFVSERDGNSEIYVMNADGTSPIRLTNNEQPDYNPHWR